MHIPVRGCDGVLEVQFSHVYGTTVTTKQSYRVFSLALKRHAFDGQLFLSTERMTFLPAFTALSSPFIPCFPCILDNNDDQHLAAAVQH